MMDYLSNLFGGGNAAGGMRMPKMGQGMDLYGGQPPSMNLGMGSKNPYINPDTGTGMMAPASFGQMPTGGMDMSNAKLAMALLDAGQPQAAPMPQVKMPMGSNQSYEQLMKMYGVRGLLG
jgi:hypothetical protein